MIKRTMQEWADFTGCYVVKRDKLVSFYHGKPLFTEFRYDEPKWWGNGKSTWLGDLSSIMFADFAEHDRRVLVEPHMGAGHE